MNSSVTRTELLAFWYWIENESAPSRSMSKPASRSTRALRSSLTLHQMNSSTSGWSASRMTIFAARRVLPPDLIVPADASAPRMKLTGPDAVPPPSSSSTLERIFDRLMPEPEPPLKIMPSSRYQLRIAFIVSSTARMKQLCTRRLPLEVLAALGLDVVDVHLAEILDALDLESLGVAMRAIPASVAADASSCRCLRSDR